MPTLATPANQIWNEVQPELILALQEWIEIPQEKKKIEEKIEQPKKAITVDLSPQAITAMVRAKIKDDLFRFRTCCTDAQASR